MYLMYYNNAEGVRVYTLSVGFDGDFVVPRLHACSKFEDASHAIYLFYFVHLQKVAPDGTPTESAHPARFSPDDKFSRERVTCKKRFNLLPTQQPERQY